MTRFDELPGRFLLDLQAAECVADYVLTLPETIKTQSPESVPRICESIALLIDSLETVRIDTDEWTVFVVLNDAVINARRILTALMEAFPNP